MKDRPKPVPCDAHRLQKRRVPTISIEKRRGLIELFVSYPEAAGYRAGYVVTTTPRRQATLMRGPCRGRSVRLLHVCRRSCKEKGGAAVARKLF